MARCLPNHYASQKLWLADDLAASISSRTDTKYQLDDRKIVVSVSIINTHCTFDSLHISCLSLLSGARCQQEAWAEMYNNTSMATPWSENSKPIDLFSDYALLVAGISIHTILPGKLSYNVDECAAITTRLHRPNIHLALPLPPVRGLLDPPTGASQMTDDERLQAFVCPNAPALYPDGVRQYSYDPRHMLCPRCIIEILSQRFYGWWLAERKSPRVNSRSIEYYEQYFTDYYHLQFPIWKTVGGDWNVELSDCPLTL